MTATQKHEVTYPIRQRAIDALLADPDWFVVLPDETDLWSIRQIEHESFAPYALLGGETFELLAVAGGWRWAHVQFTSSEIDGWDQEEEGPTCSICDGLGHGYPGAGPCPLEDRGWADSFDDDRGVW